MRLYKFGEKRAKQGKNRVISEGVRKGNLRKIKGIG
jgi:hypothetical protein